MVSCYICANKNAKKPINVIKKTFAAHARCQSIKSDKLCDRCYDCLEGKYKQCWYVKEDGKVSKLWGRNWSWLMSEHQSYPKFREGKEGLLEVYDLPTRALMREWIINPPSPPFTICLAVSGQKHIYPFAITSHSKTLIPILLEETLIYWQKEKHENILNAFEQLMNLGFNKTEITTGNYNINKLTKIDFEIFDNFNKMIENYRNTEILDLISFIAQSSKNDKINLAK